MARGQNLELLQKVVHVFMCWSFLEVYIFATTYRKAFIVGPKVPYPNPTPTPPHPTPTLPYPTPPYCTLPYSYLPFPTLPHPYPTLLHPYPPALPLPYLYPDHTLPLPYPTPPISSYPYPTSTPTIPSYPYPTPTLPNPALPLPYPTLLEFNQMHITKPVAVELRCHATALIFYTGYLIITSLTITRISILRSHFLAPKLLFSYCSNVNNLIISRFHL